MLINSVERNAGVDFWVGRINAGTGAGKINVYDNAAKDTLLATMTYNTSSHTAGGVEGTEGAGTQSATDGKAWIRLTVAVEDLTPVAAGTAGYVEVVDSDNTLRQAGSPGLAGSGEFLELSTLTIATTVAVKVTNGFLSVPAGAL